MVTGLLAIIAWNAKMSLAIRMTDQCIAAIAKLLEVGNQSITLKEGSTLKYGSAVEK